MKITLTNKELIALVAARYGLPADITLEIIENTVPAFIQKAIDAVEKIGVYYDTKIACIKAFRAETNMGLADSKGCIEQWDAFKQYVSFTGKLPVNPLCTPIRDQYMALL